MTLARTSRRPSLAFLWLALAAAMAQERPTARASDEESNARLRAFFQHFLGTGRKPVA